MGFPVSYSEHPKLLLNLLFLLAHLRKLTDWTYRSLGLSSLSDGDLRGQGLCLMSPDATEVIQEASPVTRFENMAKGEAESCCAVCLYEFEPEDEVRRMSNCSHIFHRQCVDQWIQQRQHTCPLCRAPLIPGQPPTDEEIERWVWRFCRSPVV